MKDLLPFVRSFLLSVSMVSIFVLYPQAGSHLWAADKSLHYAEQGPLAVEIFEFRDLWDKDRPAYQKPKRFGFLSGKRQGEEGQQGRNIPLKLHIPNRGGPFPLVIVSHGAGGNWDTHYAQASHLASHGYAVFCVEHTGSNTERLKESLRLLHNLKEMVHDASEVLGRPKDMQFALDQAARLNREHPKLKGRLQLEQVGVLGHSFGAFTVMATAGMRPALDWITPPINSGKGLGPDLFEPRVKCAVALSPQGPGDPFFLQESYRSLRVPMLGISGTEDKQLNGDPATARYQSFDLWPAMDRKHRFLWLEKAAHMDFTDAAGQSKVSRDSPLRAEVQVIVRAVTLMFFEQCLKEGGWNTPLLTLENLRAYERSPIRIVDLRQK